MVEVWCDGGPRDGRRVDVEPVQRTMPPMLITVDGVRYVRAPTWGGIVEREGWRYVPLND